MGTTLRIAGIMVGVLVLLLLAGIALFVSVLSRPANDYKVSAVILNQRTRAMQGTGTVRIVVDGRTITQGPGGFQSFTDTFQKRAQVEPGQRVTVEVTAPGGGGEPFCNVIEPQTIGADVTVARSAGAVPGPGGERRASCAWTRPAA